MWTGFCRNGRGPLVLIAALLALAACQTPAPPPRPQPAPPAPPPQGQPAQPAPAPQEPKPETPPSAILTPPHMEGRQIVRIGLLLPFGASSAALRKEARSMLEAAQLAVFEADDPRLLLLPKDSGGTPEAAKSSAEAVIAEGADIIIGPVLSSAVSAAAEPARQAHIPVIAFSTDRSAAGQGVYLLSFTPEADIARMVGYIQAQNQAAFESGAALRPETQGKQAPAIINAVALLRPQGRYGDRVEEALFTYAPPAGLAITDIALYGRDVQSMDAPARQIAHVEERRAAIEAWKEAGGVGDPNLDPEFDFQLPYQAVFIPESGVRLRSLAPLLPFYDVDPKITRFIGVHLWNDATLLREPALFGGWFPGPAAAPHEAFKAAYGSAFAEPPGRLASLAHDAIMVAAQSSRPQAVPDGTSQDEAADAPQDTQGKRGIFGLFKAGHAAETGQETGGSAIDMNILLRPEGFYGADGRFRFGTDGLVQRLLSVFEIKPGKIVEIDPAPPVFDTTPPLPSAADQSTGLSD